MRRVLFGGVTLAIAAVAMAGSADAAWGWRGGFWGPRFFGPTIGFGIYAPLYVPPPVVYAPPPVVVQPGYVAPPAPAAVMPAQPNPANWYYCSNPQGYYPYIRQCSGQWMTVPANPNAAAQ